MASSTASVQVSLAVYFIGLACGQAFYGPFSDRWGRKRALYFGLTLFSASSVGCAMAGDVTALIALRFLQALGGCARWWFRARSFAITSTSADLCECSRS